MFPWWALASAAGAASSMFGGEAEYQMTPAEAWRLKMARQMYREAKGRVPGAAPDERYAMGEANALIGQQGSQMMEGLFAESAGGYGDTGGSSGDMLSRLSNMLLTNKAMATSQMMASFVRNKRSDMQNAVGMAGGGGGQWQQPEDFSGLFAGIAGQQAYAQGMRGQSSSAPEFDATVKDASQKEMIPLPAQNTEMPAEDPMARMASGGAPSAYGAAYGQQSPANNWWAKGGRTGGWV